KAGTDRDAQRDPPRRKRESAAARAQPSDRAAPEGRERVPRGGRAGDRNERPPRANATPARGLKATRPATPPEAMPPHVPRTQGEQPAGQGVRLSKWLTAQGLASRREADEWIEAGWVRVDGVPARLGQRVTPAQRIEVDPAARQQQARRVTILLHKPLGYVSGQPEDGHEAAVSLVTAANHWRDDPTRRPFHPAHARGLAPAGRLDIDSTGLLVLTQDGRVAKQLIGDDSAIEKEYLVRVEPMRPGPLAPDALERLRHGLELDGRPLKPARVSWANEDRLRFVLREGRKRQIRRMCELVGLKVVALKRVRIGRIVLGKLPPGQWRYLADHERF
ncbi:pseudouridine synthase, partial [Azohydromonas sediminis]|uniref:pseudouridine synthase n=1 Tax=Azohydromonas sediminis TaxID=2259674 RepID=UPI001F179ABA